MAKSIKSTERRKTRIRRAIRAKRAVDRAFRVFRSSAQIYAQVIDDEKGVTLAAASTLEKTLRAELKTGANIEAAQPRRQGDRRARQEGRRRQGRVRSRRLHVSRSRQGARRRRARGRPRLLTSVGLQASGGLQYRGGVRAQVR